MDRTLVEAVMRYGIETPDKKAVCFRKDIVTYGELTNKIQRAAAFLHSQNVVKGSRVLLTAVSKPEYVVGLLAIQYLGAVAVPIDKNSKKESIRGIIEAVSPALMLSDTQNMGEEIPMFSLKKLANMDGAVEESEYALPEMDDPLELLFTTGTTGRPKGAILTRRCIYANMHNTWHGIGMEESDVVLIPLPLNHSFGMRVLRSTLYIGATVILQNGFAFAREIEENIDSFHCTALVSVPASMEVILGQMQDKAAEILGRLRYIEIGAGALNGRLRKKLPEMLPNTELHNTWGSTESGGAVFLNVSRHQDKIGSIGKPLEHIAIKVLDAENHEMENTDASNAGRMALKGDMQMAGYWDMPEQTADAIQDGWLVTNDLVYLDDDGYVYMLGRADDIINVGGEKVSPVEVENVASEYDGIKECACIGVKDTEGVLGQIPILYLVPFPTYDEGELVHFLTERLEKYKLPQKYVFIDELPRNRMKKLDRKALYRRWDEIGDTNLINPVIQNILSRRSIRRFTDQEIPQAILDMIVKAGIYAPSGHNLQTWRFTVIKAQDKISELKEVTRKAATGKKVLFYGFENPKYLVLVSNDRRNPDGIQDASCAAQNIMLAAHSYGVSSVWLNPLMTICDEREIRAELKSFGIPDKHIVWAMIALGYSSEEGNMLAKKTDVIRVVE